MIPSHSFCVPPWRADDCETVWSTVAQSGSISTPCGTDDKFATTWRPISETALVSALLSPTDREFPFSFGRYDLLGILGEGNMGSVFLAHDKQLDRRVAMKIPKRADGPEASRRFEREACVMAKLRHPNICPVYDVGEHDGTRFFTMAHIEGATLSEQLVATSPPSSRQTGVLIRKLALALDAVHAAGIIHRDLKPANIMIDTAGEPIIMDFGLAKSAGGAIAAKGGMLGTPAYMPPEQVMGNVAGPASDIYSLGVVMYELLAGCIPFEGSLSAVLQQVVSAEPSPPSRFNPGLDGKLEAICLQAMAKKLGDRFSSAAALADALE